MRNCSALLLFLLASALLSLPVRGQDVGSLTGDRAVKVFIEGSAARAGQGVGVLWGGSAGAYLQGHLLGLVVRGTALPGNASFRIYNAVLGPRVALNLPIFRLFAEAGGGFGHTGFYNPDGSFGTEWAPSWQVSAGLSHGLLPRLEWRVVELSYARIYAGPGVSPEMISTGFALHL